MKSFDSRPRDEGLPPRIGPCRRRTDARDKIAIWRSNHGESGPDPGCPTSIDTAAAAKIAGCQRRTGWRTGEMSARPSHATGRPDDLARAHRTPCVEAPSAMPLASSRRAGGRGQGASSTILTAENPSFRQPGPRPCHAAHSVATDPCRLLRHRDIFADTHPNRIRRSSAKPFSRALV